MTPFGPSVVPITRTSRDAETVRTFPERKPTEEISSTSEVNDVEVLDHAVDHLLHRYRGRLSALADIVGVPVHTVEKWGASGLSRPRSWHITRLIRRDHVFRAMMAPALGESASPISPEELDAYFKLKAAMRASAISGDVAEELESK